MEHMKEQPAIAVPDDLVSVVGQQYCVPSREHLVITESSRSIHGFRGFIISNALRHKLLQVKLKSGGFHGFFPNPKQLVEDMSGDNILTIRRKESSSPSKQSAFKGSSKDTNDIMFSAKVSRSRTKSTQVNVFLGTNTKNSLPDFKMESKSRLKESTFYSAGDGTLGPPLARITKERKPFQLCGSEKDSWQVDLAQHVDYVFIVSLFMMMVDIEAIE